MKTLSTSGFFAAALCAVFFFDVVSGAHADKWHLHVLASPCAPEDCSGGGMSSGPLLIDAAGDIFGAITNGGVHGDGEIFELVKEPGKTKRVYRAIYNFCALNGCMDGDLPQGAGLVTDNAGNVYGTTTSGGSAGAGTFFKLSPNKNGKYWNLTVLYNFCSKNSACTDGGDATGPLAYAGAAQGLPYDGVSPLYGTAFQYGSHGHGVVFSLTPKANHPNVWKEDALYSFCRKKEGQNCRDGSLPNSVTVDSAGDLIGVTRSGANGVGVLFKLSRVVGQRNWMETVLYSFCSQENCADGAYPVGAPLIDQNGNMFGVTGSGGTTQCFNGVVGDCGVLYELTDDGTEKVLYNFCSLQDCKDGLAPYGSLIADASGNLYGTTQAGGGYYDNGYEEFGAGTVFRFSNATLETLHAFCAETNCPDGAYPTTGVAIASFGDLFGTTAEGGPSQSGEVFELKP